MKSWFINRSVLLAFVIVFQAGGMLLINMVQQFSTGAEMKKQLDNYQGQFQFLSLSLKDFLHSKIERSEISLAGEMYDIKSVDICGDSVSLIVLRDQEEENLLKRIGDFFRTDKPGKKSNPLSLYQLLTDKYIAPAKNTIPPFTILRKSIFAFLVITLNFSIPDLPGPPPK